MTSFFVSAISPWLVLMKDHWEPLNEKGVAVVYVGSNSIISLKLFVSPTFIYILCFSPGGQGRLWQQWYYSWDVLIFLKIKCIEKNLYHISNNLLVLLVF